VAQIKWRGMDPLKLAFRLGKAIRKERKGTYSDNWAIMSLDSLLSAAFYKIDRARHTEDPDKQLDDLIDAFNYICFAIARVVGPRNTRVAVLREVGERG